MTKQRNNSEWAKRRTKYPHLYGWKWRQARLGFLTNNPLCAYCQEENRITPATEVDHIKPHHGDPELFWDEDNWQGLCGDHHQSSKQKLERSGKEVGCDVNGNPLRDAEHWR